MFNLFTNPHRIAHPLVLRYLRGCRFELAGVVVLSSARVSGLGPGQ
jgi:hypothetical protein